MATIEQNEQRLRELTDKLARPSGQQPTGPTIQNVPPGASQGVTPVLPTQQTQQAVTFQPGLTPEQQLGVDVATLIPNVALGIGTEVLTKLFPPAQAVRLGLTVLGQGLTTAVSELRLRPALEQALGVTPPERSLPDVALPALIQGVGTPVAEFAGRVAKFPIEKTVGPVRPEVAERAAKLEKVGVEPIPPLVVGPFGQGMTQALRTTAVGGKVMNEAFLRTQSQLETAFDNFLTTIAPSTGSRIQAGVKIRQAIEQAKRQIAEDISDGYKVFDREINKLPPITPKNLIRIAAQELKALELKSPVRTQVKKILDEVAKNPRREIPLARIKELRDFLSRRDIPGSSSLAANNIFNAITNDFETALPRLSKEAAASFREGTKRAAAKFELLNLNPVFDVLDAPADKVVAKLSENPESLRAAKGIILRNTSGQLTQNVTDFMTFDVMPSPRAIQQYRAFQRAVLERLASASRIAAETRGIRSQVEFIDPNKLRKTMEKVFGDAPEVLDEFFSVPTDTPLESQLKRQAFQNYLTALELFDDVLRPTAQSFQAASATGGVVKLGDVAAGALAGSIGVASGGVVGGLVGLLSSYFLVVPAMAKIMTSPTVAKFLSHPDFIPSMAQLLGKVSGVAAQATGDLAVRAIFAMTAEVLGPEIANAMFQEAGSMVASSIIGTASAANLAQLTGQPPGETFFPADFQVSETQTPTFPTSNVEFSRPHLAEQLQRFEKLSEKPTEDPGRKGQMNIGFGSKLASNEIAQFANGITEEQANIRLERDIRQAEQLARSVFKNFDTLSPARQDALVHLAFNLKPIALGIGGQVPKVTFTRFIQAVNENRLDDAARELLFVNPASSDRPSEYVKDVGVSRAVEVAEQLRSGRRIRFRNPKVQDRLDPQEAREIMRKIRQGLVFRELSQGSTRK